MLEGQVYGVEQRRLAFGFGKCQIAFDFSGFWVKGRAIRGVSLNCTRKNSSSGLAVLKNSATAMRDFRQL